MHNTLRVPGQHTTLVFPSTSCTESTSDMPSLLSHQLAETAHIVAFPIAEGINNLEVGKRKGKVHSLKSRTQSGHTLVDAA